VLNYGEWSALCGSISPASPSPVQFPDPLSPPLDDTAAFEKFDTFLDTLLRALDRA
jgi:hypothetical protein